LNQVLAAAEPEPDAFGRRWREALAQPGREALVRLADGTDEARLSPAILVQLAEDLWARGAKEAAVRLLRRGQQRYPADFWLNLELGLKLRLRSTHHALKGSDEQAMGRWLRNAEEAVRYLTAAAALRPSSPGVLVLLGVTLGEVGDADGAIRTLRRALLLDPRQALAAHNLGWVLQKREDWKGAIQAYRLAATLDPNLPNRLGTLAADLKARGHLGEAIGVYRQAVEVRPRNEATRLHLIQALKEHGQFREARDESRKALDLPHQRNVAAVFRWQQKECEKLMALDARLGAIRKGEAQPQDAWEMHDLAGVFEVTRRYAAGACFFADTFAAQPQLTADLRFPAACFAARAGCGDGADAARLDEKERAGLRHQALTWLRDELSAWDELLRWADMAWQTRSGDLGREMARDAMSRWLSSKELRCVREPPPFDQLFAPRPMPAAERKVWAKLWADVKALNKRALEK
jgi:tetratricopeptide (TPR) repeat protein